MTLKPCWDVWCDLCGEPTQSTVLSYGTKHAAREGAKACGWTRLRVDGRLYDVCRACRSDESPYRTVRQQLRARARPGGEPVNEWNAFLNEVEAAGGCTDMQTSATGRYPWLFHFCRGQADRLGSVVIYAHVRVDGRSKVISSPPRDWRTKDSILGDYKALQDHGAIFNDSVEALGRGQEESR